MIEKMYFVTLAGPKAKIDDLVTNYLSVHDIHLEDAMKEFQNDEHFSTFYEENPFTSILSISSNLMSLVKNPERVKDFSLKVPKAEHIIKTLNKEVSEIQQKITALEKKREILDGDYDFLSPFKSLNYPLGKIRNMKAFKHSFGKLPRGYYEKFRDFLDPLSNEIFIDTFSDNDFVYGVFFAPAESYAQVEKDLLDMHFEPIRIPVHFEKDPSAECINIENQKVIIDEQLKREKEKIDSTIEAKKSSLVAADKRIRVAYNNFDVRKKAAVTKDKNASFNVLCGWMPKTQAKQLEAETADDVNVICLISDDTEGHSTTPPTKLKNNFITKPFELFVRMYGLPSYNEFDPTLFLAISYSLIFGAMFGDIGQGLCLLLGGLVIYLIKKMPLAGIISVCGFSSMVFGLIFGSFFGFEFPSLLKPLSTKITLTGIGEINLVLVVAFLFGSFMILSTMIINMIIAIKQKNLGKFLFGPNALTGLIFYGSAILVIILYCTNQPLPATIVLILMFVVPLILILLKDPLTNLINKKKALGGESAGMFFATAFFEVFEYLLTYLSNGLSFLRVGVFAISHAAMMEVVITLAGAANGATPNIPIIIIGNIIVIGLEGLIVGIQVLRLEYYEMFGRFYEGSGREFVSHRKNIK